LTFHVQKLQQSHALDGFDCGNEDLNRFLKKDALVKQIRGLSTTFLGLDDRTVVGYYSLASGSTLREDAPAKLGRGLPSSIPITLLARFAIDHRFQRRGVGKGLLKDAMLRTLQAADIVGSRAIVVHAKDEAKGFYLHFNFIPSPTDPLHLYIALKDVREIV
jgi:GNAT superfamily N-acetyltransferase